MFSFYFKVFSITFLSIILLHTSASAAIDDQIIFQKLGIEEGLSQNTSFCIHQDAKGFMWFGTEDGLNRYNGYTFKVFKHNLKDSSSITASYILDMFEDKQGRLWIGSDGGGLSLYNPDRENFISYMHNPSAKNSISNNRVTSICEDAKGNIWLGTLGGGLNMFDPVKATFTVYKNNSDSNSLSHNNVNDVLCDTAGVLWVATDNGLNRFDPATNSFTRFYAVPYKRRSLSSSHIITLFQDSKGLLWIGTYGGGLNKRLETNDGNSVSFMVFKRDYSNPYSISGNDINAIFEDKSGDLWVGTDGNGLNKLVPPEKGRPVGFTRYVANPSDPNSLANNDVYSIYEDRSGVLWIGTKGGGISKYDREKKKFTIVRNKPNANSINNNAVRVITEDNKANLWIGSDGGGLDHFNIKTGIYTNYSNDPLNPNSLSHNYIRAIQQDKKGYIWVGTDGGGLNLLNSKTGRITRYRHDPENPNSLSSDVIRPVKVDRFGYIWIGTLGGGLNRFDPRNGKFRHYRHDAGDNSSISHDYIYAIYEDRSGMLWIGTDGGGLELYDRDKDNFKHYKHDDQNPYSLSQNNVYTIYEDAQGFMWFGTRGGMNKFDRKQQRFTNYTEQDGLPNSTLYGILGDEEGNIWLSTNKGIAKFNPQTEEFKNYDVNDGLQSNEFNGGAYFKSRDGAMYFGGIDGMNKFFPAEIVDNPNIPPVVITDFQIFNKAVPIAQKINNQIILQKSIAETQRIELSFQEKVFSFEFAALNYVAPEKNQYAYFMENFDSDWNYIGSRRFVSYTNIPAGDYIFRVKASNSDGVWNEEGTYIQLIIHPPFWQTWWFRALMLIIVLLAIYFIYRARVRSIEERSRELEENVKKRTKQATLLYETGQRLSSQLELDALLSEIVNTIYEAFKYYAVSLLLPNKKGDIFTLRSLASDFKDTFSGMKVKKGKGLIGKAAATKKIQVSADVSKDPTFILRSNEKTKSELSVPIISGDKVIGVLDIQSDRENTFEQSDIAALETLSTHIASAIDNARLYDQAQCEINDRKKAEEELRHAKRETDDILQNVKEGLFLLNKDLAIESQYSAALEDILEEKELGKKSFVDYLKSKVDKKTVEDVTHYLELLFDDSIFEDTLADLNPLSEIEFKFKIKGARKALTKYLAFDFRRIKENETTEIIIATVSDITEKIYLEKDLEESRSENKRKMDLLLAILNVDPAMLSDFLNSAAKETAQILSELKSVHISDGAVQSFDHIYRLLHNIKGNASLLELEFFAEKAHKAENYIQKIKDVKKLNKNHINDLSNQVEDLVRTQDEVQELIKQLGQVQDHLRPKRNYEHDNLVKSLQKLVAKLSGEYDKKVNLVTDNFKGEIIPNYHRLLIRDILVQLVRNSMHHGIEQAEEREKAGKDALARIKIENYQQNGSLCLVFEDDGRGLDLQGLSKKALELGKWQKEEIENWDKQALSEIIYAAGVTTSKHATLEAGRGVGMDIIKNKIKQYEGSIAVDFKEGEYCRFSITLPLK